MDISDDHTYRTNALQDISEVRSASQHIHDALTKVPVLEWFVRDPVDESSLEIFFSRLLG